MSKTKKEQFETALSTIGPENIGLLLEVRKYSNKYSIDPKQFWDFIPPARFQHLTAKQLGIIQGKKFAIKEMLGTDWEKDPFLQLTVTKAILDPKFMVVRHQNCIFLYEIANAEAKILSPIYEGDAERIVNRYLSRAVLKFGAVPLSPAKARRLVGLWVNHADALLGLPEPMAMPGVDVWCLHRPIYFPDPDQSINTWMKVLGRMSDPEAFAAWIWGLYSDCYKGRQILWIQGGGEDGKSLIAKLLAQELFGPAHSAIGNAHLGSQEKRFLYSYFEGSRLVIYPDANNRRALMSEQLKCIAGGGADIVLIEAKGRQGRPGVIKARMLIASNYSPEVTNDRFVISRLLYIEIQPLKGETPDPRIEEQLKQELPGFLHYASQAYAKKCTDDYKIEAIKSIDDRVQALADTFYDDFDAVFSKHFEVATEEEFILASKLRDILRKEGIRNTHQHRDFIDWLAKDKGVRRVKKSSDSGKIHYYGMRRLGARPAGITDTSW